MVRGGAHRPGETAPAAEGEQTTPGVTLLYKDEERKDQEGIKH